MPRDGGDDCEKTVTIDAVTHEQVLTETSAILSRKRRWTVERNNYGLGHDEEQEVEHTSEQGTSKESEPAENHLNDFGSTPSSSRVYELFMSDSIGNEFFDLDIGPAADKENLENCTVDELFDIPLETLFCYGLNLNDPSSSTNSR